MGLGYGELFLDYSRIRVFGVSASRCGADHRLGFGVLYFNTFCLVLGSYFIYLYLKSIYFFSRVYSTVG